jgi:hypothetical protein
MKYLKYISQILLLFIFCSDIYAQVPVIKEPHHKPVLVNNYIRLLDVHLNAGDTTQYHIHAAPSVIVMISNSTIGIQKSGEAPAASGNVTAGSTSFVDYGKNPITHRVYNSGNNIFHVMDIELAKKNHSADSCNALQENNIETTINNNLVRVYKFALNTNNSLHINKSSCAHLLICISGAVSTSNKKITTGEYTFFNPNTDVSINNNQKDSSTCVVVELK